MPNPTLNENVASLIERLRSITDIGVVADRPGGRTENVTDLVAEAADTLERYEREREALLSDGAIRAGAEHLFSEIDEMIQGAPDKKMWFRHAKAVIGSALQHAQEEVGE